MNGPTVDRLPCGTRVDALLDQVDAGQAQARTPHQLGCPHCQAALAELDALWAPMRALAAERVVAPPGMVVAIMGRVRELANRVWYTLLPESRGATRIAARVVAVIARRAAAGVPGVRVALGRSTDPVAARTVEQATRAHAAPGTAVGVAGAHLAVDLALATAYDSPIPAVAERVRRAVVRDVRAATGIADVEVNITVDDVLGG